MTEEMNEAPFKAVDMSQFKRTYLGLKASIAKGVSG